MSRGEQRPLEPYNIQIRRMEETREWSTDEVVAEIPIRAIDHGCAQDVGEAIIKLYEREYRVTYAVSVTQTEQPDEEI
ncbi:hypothetical protein JT327_gp25 [Aeromonas phage LAh_7]|jgi:hypothetical protein|uniref:Uncharacterized protein n=1 Tax=Aeromonas phage LAh_7 TaxID=2591031 RepID=A0A514A0B2_9CAUD|nr:hypothetical protein JT327_gp25 [Aeromonas phage LAh_7]MBX7019370.1 hypothetical protein [Providencia rettgeri]QDH46709.1 hypothetical protein LAh7_25 [Aeromonas phage LAh_7]